MSLTRKMLTAMGIEAEKIDQIIESHTETVDGLKKVADDLREQAGKVPDLERKIGELEKAQPTEDYEGKFKDLKAEFDTYKEKVAAEQAQAEKARLYRSLLREAGIDEKRLDAIMRVTDLSGVTVEDGAIVDAETVSEQIKKDYPELPAFEEYSELLEAIKKVIQ